MEMPRSLLNLLAAVESDSGMALPSRTSALSASPEGRRRPPFESAPVDECERDGRNFLQLRLADHSEWFEQHIASASLTRGLRR